MVTSTTSQLNSTLINVLFQEWSLVVEVLWMFSFIPRYRIRGIFDAIKWKVQNFVFLACFNAAMWWYTGVSSSRLDDISFMREQSIVGGGDLLQLLSPPYRIFTAVLLHGGRAHLMGNTMGFVSFASAAIIFAERE